jgi:hypothetical protein
MGFLDKLWKDPNAGKTTEEKKEETPKSGRSSKKKNKMASLEWIAFGVGMFCCAVIILQIIIILTSWTSRSGATEIK